MATLGLLKIPVEDFQPLLDACLDGKPYSLTVAKDGKPTKVKVADKGKIYVGEVFSIKVRKHEGDIYLSSEVLSVEDKIAISKHYEKENGSSQ